MKFQEDEEKQNKKEGGSELKDGGEINVEGPKKEGQYECTQGYKKPEGSKDKESTAKSNRNESKGKGKTGNVTAADYHVVSFVVS